ncbi:methionyl-tRNA formyltransferase/UDP-4-amino-4-deoxy-L-arabinose formyltransferase / UDP-glucuronic acid dehydrogenase (UDP-4-keto-hexauronic acid decarboxylating) [Filimonas lacunae]|uniref:Methionyl-tRNA formyltransferase/UDP-4-amino-4-deoxy-L-arabinose formyltransferase / UDP-glucuronic acid dehydrogenase (UDP-4-keto-hexauronic acid decarboxylating) n=1 Tax=Filimonas lacunae TaxID=477680 RepID=A0A173M9X7_9BACT|nr:formyltransferase family protein [Filimonas lacunae]BAV04320.1 UDP-glucuronic acid oxidase [Filimonas lacunae]SIT31014.1 methionyl-tRNA formyltransferase/UDP-4-amino-4-deoxy-L-arabinose formyltransferase / UDP-glucuronic acid dehydrogenase (UDP-4-keto-hexauronic acid decarboxylating) [Filimonas lacunae]
MTTIILCNSDTLAIPTIMHLQQTGQLGAVVIPDKSAAFLQNALAQVMIAPDKIYVTSKKQLADTVSTLITNLQAELLLTLTFPWKLPDSILTLPSKGCLNAHFGLLPQYAGADPVFWQLRNGEKQGGITIHVMTSDIDAGPVVCIQEIPLMPLETYGIHCERLGHAMATLFNKLSQSLQHPKQPATPQTPSPALYFSKPGITDLTIQWEQQTADEMIQLVNATNPRYGGAITRFRDIQVSLLEVLPININNPPDRVVPGTIVHIDSTHGIIAACANNTFIRITILQLREGYLSGSKLSQMGWQAGEIFY